MATELKELIHRLLERVHHNKIQLLRGVDAIKRKNELQLETNYKKCRSLQRMLIRAFLRNEKNISIPLCLKAPLNPNIPNSTDGKIVLMNQKQCLHGRLAFINELTSISQKPVYYYKSIFKKVRR